MYSSPDSLLARAAQQAVFPDNTYGVDSGGDPLKIPDLTFKGFKDFHAEFYHPSNRSFSSAAPSSWRMPPLRTAPQPLLRPRNQSAKARPPQLPLPRLP